MSKLSTKALEARISKLQKQLAAAKINKAPAIKRVKKLMKKLGITIADITGSDAPGKARLGRTPGKRGPKRGGKVSIKYRDDAGNTWTGRGKTPRWLTAAEKKGTKRDRFLVK